jgi:tetratricopeptide (TPR) repeat protein
MAFLDSDDAWSPDKLERQLAAMKSSTGRAGLCVCSMEVSRAGVRHHVRYADEELDSATAVARIVSGVGMGTPCWLARRDVMQAVGGFDESLPRMQDYECALRIAQQWRVLLMSDVLVRAELGVDSISASADRYVRAIEIIIGRHRALFERHRSGYSHMVFRAGKYLALEGRQREAIPWFVRALRIRPTNARALVGAALCMTGLFPLVRKFKYE